MMGMKPNNAGCIFSVAKLPGILLASCSAVAQAAISLPPMNIPANGNVGDIVWESPDTIISSGTTSDSSFTNIYGGLHSPSMTGDTDANGNIEITPGLVLAFKGTTGVGSGGSDFLCQTTKSDYLTPPTNVPSHSAQWLMWCKWNNTGGWPSWKARFQGRVAVVRTATTLSSGVYTIPAVVAWSQAYNSSSGAHTQTNVTPATSITVLSRSCSVQLSNSAINFGTMHSHSAGVTLSSDGQYSTVSASCSGGVASDAAENTYIRLSATNQAGDINTVDTGIPGVVVKGSLVQQPCSATGGWLPFDGATHTSLGSLAAGDSATMTPQNIWWRVCQTQPRVANGPFNASANYNLTIY